MPHAPPSMADAVLWPPQFSPRATGVRGCDATGDADHRRGAVACRPGTLTMGALKSSRILQPVHARFSILSPSWLWGLRDVAVLAGSPGCSQRRNGCSPAARTHLSAQYADRARRCHRGGYRSGPRRVTQKQAVQNGQSQCHPSRLGTSLLLDLAPEAQCDVLRLGYAINKERCPGQSHRRADRRQTLPSSMGLRFRLLDE
jgi:hypothetical protein